MCYTISTHFTWNGIRSCSVLMYNSLIQPQYLTHCRRCDANGNIQYTAVSETPCFCLMVRLCVCIFECLWVCVCVYVCCHVPVYLIVCLPWQQQSSWKDADTAKAKKRDRDWAKRQNEREREIGNGFQWNCDFLDEMNVRSHSHVQARSQAHTHTQTHVNKEQSLEIDADIKIPTGDLGYFYQLRWWLMNT